MSEIAHSIKLDIARKLRDDADFRRKFFWSESSALIAKQLIALRKRRKMNQSQVAEQAATKQPAISRAEKADYQNWSFSTIRKIADALNARVRVIIEPAEDVLCEYDTETDATRPVEVKTGLRRASASSLWQLVGAGPQMHPPKIEAENDGPEVSPFVKNKELVA